MAENPLKCFENLDPELLKLVGDGRQFALGEGALPKKYKYLIAMALDAAHGASDGVRNLAQAAMKEGATKKEVAEALRVRPVRLRCRQHLYRRQGASGAILNTSLTYPGKTGYLCLKKSLREAPEPEAF